MPKKPAPRKLKQKQPVWTALFIILFVILVSFISFSFFNNYQSLRITTPSVAPQSKTYHSAAMDFTVEVPYSFEIKEGNSFIDFLSTSGKITISMNGTNINNIEDYLIWFDSMRKGVKYNNQIKQQINGTPSISRIEFFSVGKVQQQKIYYIFQNNKVYTISAISLDLYDLADQIAQSFRYTLD